MIAMHATPARYSQHPNTQDTCRVPLQSVRGDAASVLDSWKGQAAKTAQLLQLIQTYKDIGDGNNEVRLTDSNASSLAAAGIACPQRKEPGTQQRPRLDVRDAYALTQPYLKYHNPRTFEDLNKPVLNFRALNLKAGEVPKFFDNVLAGRAADAVKQVRRDGNTASHRPTARMQQMRAAGYTLGQM